MYDVTIKQRKHLNRLLRINNTPHRKLKLSFLKYICYFAMKVSKLKFGSDQSPKNIYISDFRSSPLKAFAKGFLANDLHKRNAEEISLSRFLCDTGSDTNILNYETFCKMGFKDSNLTKCGPITLKGSAGSLDNSFLGSFTSYIFLQGTDNNFYHIQQTFYVINPNLKIPNILGQPFLMSSNCGLKYNQEKQAVVISVQMHNMKYKLQKIHLLNIQTENLVLANCSVVRQGDQSALFYLKNNSDINLIVECTLAQTQHLKCAH